MKQLVALIFLLCSSLFANSVLNLGDLKPVQYPLLQKTKLTGGVQNLFIDFTASLEVGCKKHYGVQYGTADIYNQIRGMKFGADVKDACLFPVLVKELNGFTEEYLKLKKEDLVNGNAHLTLASRIYEADFLNFVDDDTDENHIYYDLTEIKVHTAILYRMIRQTLPDAIKVSNTWFSQNSLEKIRNIRKISGWISEITPWGYFAKLSFYTRCEGVPFQQDCELDKQTIQVALMKAVQDLRINSNQYDYLKNLRTSFDNMSNDHRMNIRRGLQVIKGLAGEFVPYMIAPTIMAEGKILRPDLFEVVSYLEKSKSDLDQSVTPRLEKIEKDYNCKTILRSFVSLQKETKFSLKDEMKHLNPFPFVTEETDNIYEPLLKDGITLNDLVDKINCKKIRDSYLIPLEDEGFLTRFMAYQARVMLASTKNMLSADMTEEEKKESVIYTQLDDVLTVVEKMESVESILSTTQVSADVQSASTQLNQYINKLIKE